MFIANTTTNIATMTDNYNITAAGSWGENNTGLFLLLLIIMLVILQ